MGATKYSMEQQIEWAKERSATRHSKRRRVTLKPGKPIKRQKVCGNCTTQQLINMLWGRQKGLCACCRKPLGSASGAATIDHLVPLNEGGNHQWSNLRLLRRECLRDKKT